MIQKDRRQARQYGAAGAAPTSGPSTTTAAGSATAAAQPHQPVDSAAVRLRWTAPPAAPPVKGREPDMLTATLTGNLGQDPELKYSQNGSPFLRFQVASNYRARDEHGQWVETVEWIRVTVLGARAESLGQHLRKGQRVCVVGRLEARPWVDSNDNVRAGLELTANEVDFMSSREQNSQGSGQPGQGHPQQAQSGQREAPPASSGPSNANRPAKAAVSGCQSGMLPILTRTRRSDADRRLPARRDHRPGQYRAVLPAGPV